MADLTKPMSVSEINRLDYFEKAQLYHNVYYNNSLYEIPTPLRPLYLADEGLSIVKATIASANVKDPYEIAKLIKTLNPAKPQTLQEVYSRAAYLADICDTSVEKILKSDIFNTKDFIPQLTAAALKTTLANKTTGMLVPLTESDYVPAPDEGGDTPTPVPMTGDYADEEKIYFVKDGETITCETNFAKVIAKAPKLPAAELLLGAGADSQNILNISCGYNELRNVVDFNFIRMYDTTIEFLTVHYASSGITYEVNNVVIEGGNSSGGTTITYPVEDLDDGDDIIDIFD